MKTTLFDSTIKTTYTVIRDQQTNRLIRIRYFVKNVPVQLRPNFKNWISIVPGEYAKDAREKNEAITIINELKEMGINC